MLQGNTALVVSGAGGVDLSLRKVLFEAGMHVRVVTGCGEARLALRDLGPPAVVFCDVSLPDGAWNDVLLLSTSQGWNAPVVVVSRVVDINLYINVLEMGAADFVVPPFYAQDISHVLNCAIRENTALQTRAAA